MKIYSLLMVLLLLGSLSYAVTNITSLPFTASTPDTYVLTGDLNSSGNGVTISGNNITLDCQNFTMTGPYTSSTAGIINTGNNTTIINCVVKDFGNNLQFAAGDDGYVSNNTFDHANLTSILIGTTSSVNRLNFSNNTFSNGFNNGIEYYGGQNVSFLNNTCFGHEHGHGTDRCFQVVSNTNNLELAYNHFYNNTFCMRFDNNNQSNIYVHDNLCENNTNGLNMQSTVGTFTNFTFVNNVMLGLANNTGFDITWPAIATKATDCPQITVINNTVTGGAYLWLNGSNSSQTLDNLDLGGLAMCDADDVTFNNLTIHGGGLGYNAAEFMLVNNVSVNGFDAIDVRVGLRILSVNDSYFANCNINGTQIGGINGNGGGANRNIVENCTVKDIRVGTGLSFGGANNTIRNIIITNSSTVSSAIGYGAIGTTTNNTYDNISVSNMPLGYLLTTFGANNTLQNSTFINVTQPLLINSTASGSKTLSAKNISIGFSGGINITSFDLADIVIPNQSYLISNVINPYGIPVGVNQSFLGKALNITIFNTTTAFTQLNFTWLDSEVGLLNESSITLYSNNGSGWNLRNSTPDTTNNKIAFNITLEEGSSTVFALFIDGENCPIITSSGIYLQSNNYFNATNPSAPYLDFNCVDIRANDVVFDCQGFNITNNGTPSQNIGILAVGDNITIQNCQISNYDYGEYSNGNNLQIINNSFISNGVGYSSFASSGAQIHNNLFSGGGYGLVYFFGTDNTNVSNNTFSTIIIRDIDAGTTTGSVFELNNFTGGNVGIAFLNSNTNNVTQNSFVGYGFIALQLVGADFTRVLENTFQGSSYSIDMSAGSDFNQITSNNILSTGSGSGISISQSTGNIVNLNNISSSAVDGVLLDALSFTNTVTGNIIIAAIQNGVRIGGNTNTVSLNSISNTVSAVLIEGNNTVLTNNLLFSNSRGVTILAANGTQLTADHYYNNGLDIFVNNTGATNTLLNTSLEILDDPSGSLQNFSEIGFISNVGSNASYSIVWSAEPVTLPSNTTSPTGAFFNFTILSGSPTLTNLTWLFAPPNVANSVIFYNGTWNNITSSAFPSEIDVPLINRAGVYALVNITIIPTEITSVILDYFTGTPYSNYTLTTNTITVGDTGNYLLSYRSVASGSYFGDTFIFAGFIQVLSAVLPTLLVVLVVVAGFSYYKNKENK